MMASILSSDTAIAQNQSISSQTNVKDASKTLQKCEDHSHNQSQTGTDVKSSQTQEHAKFIILQKKTIIFMILFSVSLVLLVAVSVLLIIFLSKPQFSSQPSNLSHLVGNHPDSCDGTLYTLNITLSKGPLILNITDVPECFLAANPGFPYNNQSRLLQQGGYWQWIWSQMLSTFIQMWVQNAVNSNNNGNKNSGCFPPDTVVISKSKGLIKMKQLKINDEILTKDGYSHVIGWLHKDEKLMLEYLQIGDQEERFFVSPLHNLATNSGKYAFAKEFEKIVGKTIIQGAYSPMTEAGNFFVVKSNGDKILAHVFSFVQEPEKYEELARLIFAYFPAGEYTHPLCEWFLRRKRAMDWLRIVGFQWE